MKERYQKLPEPLKKLILMRVGIGIAVAFAAVILLILGFDFYVAAPFLGVGMISLWNAFMLLSCDPLVIHGICIEYKSGSFLQKTRKAVVAVGDKKLQITLPKAGPKLTVSNAVTLYLREDAHIYEHDGLYVLERYLAVSVTAGSAAGAAASLD